jgi:hypothetical protein
VYGFQSFAPADSLLSPTSANTYAIDRLTAIVEIRDVVKHLFIISKEIMVAIFVRLPPIFYVGDLVYLSTRGLPARSQKCKHLRDQKLGLFKFMAKVGMTSYQLLLPNGCRSHPGFILRFTFTFYHFYSAENSLN